MNSLFTLLLWWPVFGRSTCAQVSPVGASSCSCLLGVVLVAATPCCSEDGFHPRFYVALVLFPSLGTHSLLQHAVSAADTLAAADVLYCSLARDPTPETSNPKP